MLLREPAQMLEPALARQHESHIAGDRLHDDSGNFVAVLLHDAGNRIKIIVRNRDGICRHALRYARTVRHAKGCQSRAGLDEQAVTMSMVAADELHNLVASRKTAGQAKRTHSRLSAGIHHTDDLYGRINAHD